MVSLAQSEPKPDPSDVFAAAYGFVPNLFQAQSALRPAVKAQAGLINAILLLGHGLCTAERKALLGVAGTTRGNQYISALHKMGDVPVISPAVVNFVSKLAAHCPCVSKPDIDSLREAGFRDHQILETVGTVALGDMLCLLAEALNPPLDFEHSAPTPSSMPADGMQWNANFGPYLNSEASIPNDLASLLRDQYGFVPGVLRSQASWPELLAAEIRALELVVFGDEHLSRVQKESILLAISVANLNTYGVALHCQVLPLLGMPPECVDAIIHASENSPLDKSDQVLLSQVSLLAGVGKRNAAAFDREALIGAGFSPPQVLEAIAVASLAQFFNTLACGLGIPPDFPPKRIFSEKDLYPSVDLIRPTSEATVRLDPDANLIVRVQAGETEAFEELVRRHTRRVFGTLNGMLGNCEEARDATQDVFIKAFEHICSFEGRAKFSTWVTSIAVNTGAEILRQRKAVVPLNDADDEHFRPRRVSAWAEDPEALFAASQMNALVREAVMRLPQKYRVAVLLRDINQLSTEDTAEALGLSVPALKARVLRGRLMLRETLATHFVRPENTDA